MPTLMTNFISLNLPQIIAVHSQTMLVPSCPVGWSDVWIGYSFVLVSTLDITNFYKWECPWRAALPLGCSLIIHVFLLMAVGASNYLTSYILTVPSDVMSYKACSVFIMG